MTIKNLTPHVELTASDKKCIRAALLGKASNKKVTISETGGFGLLVKIEWQEGGRNREKTARISIA